MLGVSDSNATRDQTSPDPTIAILGSTCLSSNNGGCSSSSSPSGDPYSAGAQSGNQAIHSPIDHLAMLDTRLAPHADSSSDSSSSWRYDAVKYHDPFGAIGVESDGRRFGLSAITPPSRSCGTGYGMEQQQQVPSLMTEGSKYATNYSDLPFNVDESSIHSQRDPEKSEALSDNRAGCIASDDSVKPYSYSVERHQPVQLHDAAHLDEHEEALMDHSSDTSRAWPNGNPLDARSLSDPTSPNSLSAFPPLAPSQDSLLRVSSTSTANLHSIQDSWECDKCGRKIATKGTKNRNRNKRRHCCPGTSPKYPCPVCPKVFNRSDTRLIHLRKWHPEIQTAPPRPRGKNT